MTFNVENTLSKNIDSIREVIIESVYVNDKILPENTFKILASDKDSITINFKLKAPSDLDKSAFLFKTIFRNGKDSSVKTVGVTRAIFKNLNNDDYLLNISAFDLQRKWNAKPVELRIEIDNEKYTLIQTKDSLNQKLEALLDVINNSSNDNSKNIKQEAQSDVLLYVLLVIIATLLIVVVIMLKNKKKTELTPPLEDRSKDSALDLIADMVSKQDFENLQIENSRLRAEIASLRGQIDAMNVRSSNLSSQNKELQSNLTKLSLYKDELEELQKQKDELFAVIIHDIKNPAALIKSLVELLTSYDLSTSEQQEIINDIANTTIKIVALSQEVSRILALETNKMNLNIEACDINILVDDVFHRNQLAAKNKSINFHQELGSDLPLPEIDPQRIDEVLDNLISNAVKFTPQGGTIRIKSYKESDKIVVEINDNGLGLTEEDLKHAFQRGARLSAKPTNGEASTGLGLWIVKKLIDAHHGKVWVKSIIGKGSTFAFSVPVKHEKSE
ncbi:MAG: HAMP domain-containing sensor histidine kinase [Candidatus Kapaibacterium sp.]|jgi:signal transduction histidine kinase